MRTNPPHALIRYRHALLALALVAWAVAGFVLLRFKGSPAIPVSAIVTASGFVFVWANGAYWWVILRYPYIEVSKGQYASRDEWKEENHGPFLAVYFAFAVFSSIACLNVAVNG